MTHYSMRHFGICNYINPHLVRADIIASCVARLRHAQPVCEPGFASKIPPVQTPILGLQVADTCFYYPEDRGISESARLGYEMAVRLNSQDISHPQSVAQNEPEGLVA